MEMRTSLAESKITRAVGMSQVSFAIFKFWMEGSNVLKTPSSFGCWGEAIVETCNGCGRGAGGDISRCRKPETILPTGRSQVLCAHLSHKKDAPPLVSTVIGGLCLDNRVRMSPLSPAWPEVSGQNISHLFVLPFGLTPDHGGASVRTQLWSSSIETI